MQTLYILITLDFQGKSGIPGPPRTYPELFALMGGKVPDLRGRVAWGDAVPGRNIEAGLPNITGDMYFEADNFFFRKWSAVCANTSEGRIPAIRIGYNDGRDNF